MLDSLNLGGDGDEIVAIEAVERKFNVRFDQSDADGWKTVGDVFASLKARLEPSNETPESLWSRFIAVLGDGSGLYANEIGQIEPATTLLAPSFRAADLLRKLWTRFTQTGTH